MSSFQTISPIDNSIYVERQHADAPTIDRALTAAQVAQKDWKNRSLKERQDFCSAMVDAFIKEKDAIAEEICWQMGRPIRFAAGEVDGMADRARTMIRLADEGLARIELPNRDGCQRWIQREALGVVMVIAPWNYPYLTAINAIIPAILAGNSVILKHSAQTPLCAERFDASFKQAQLPEGIFQYLHLTHADTETILGDSRINYAAFTGSVSGGAMVERIAAGRFIHSGLELGGKDPAYIRSDANLEQAIDTVMDGAFFNSGQSCCGIERIYVHADVYDEFLEGSIAWVNQQVLGRSDDPKTTLGPLVKPEAAEFVREQISEAMSLGAIPQIQTTLFPLDKPGTPYLAPQILTNVNYSMRVMTEESFGPVVGIQTVKSDAEAIRLMNDSEFGLTASVFTTDYERGISLGQALETGTFFINRCDYLDPELAWTGVKNSGRGCTLSRVGYESLTRPKSFYIRTAL